VHLRQRIGRQRIVRRRRIVQGERKRAASRLHLQTRATALPAIGRRMRIVRRIPGRIRKPAVRRANRNRPRMRKARPGKALRKKVHRRQALRERARRRLRVARLRLTPVHRSRNRLRHRRKRPRLRRKRKRRSKLVASLNGVARANRLWPFCCVYVGTAAPSASLRAGSRLSAERSSATAPAR